MNYRQVNLRSIRIDGGIGIITITVILGKTITIIIKCIGSFINYRITIIIGTILHFFSTTQLSLAAAVVAIPHRYKLTGTINGALLLRFRESDLVVSQLL